MMSSRWPRPIAVIGRAEPRVHRLLHGLTLDHPEPELERPALRGLDQAEPVEQVAEQVDDTPEQAGADPERS